MKYALISIVAASLISQTVMAAPPAMNPAPAGFDASITYIADGEFLMASPNPDVPGCFMAQCDGAYFWSQVAQLPADEVAAMEAQAKAFVMSRFGLDVDALVGTGAMTWRDVYADPRTNYRARTVTGEHVHRYGWEVHDQAFLAVATEELVLGGEFEGMLVPAGTGFAWGHYYIQKSRLVMTEGGPQLVNSDELIKIRYQSSAPLLPPNAAGFMSSACEIIDSPWGSGVAQFVAVFDFLADPGAEPVRQNIRNVLTFDGGTGLGTYPGVYNR